MEKTANSQNTDKPWLFKKGQSGNPSGRPKNTMKDFVSRKFSNMSDEEKEQWLKDNKINPIDIWKMGEGNPKQDTDVTSDGEKLQGVVVLPIKDVSTLETTTETSDSPSV